MTGGARECLAPARPALVQKRSDPVPQEIAREALIGVRFVLDPREASPLRVGSDVGARNAQQRPDRDHRGGGIPGECAGLGHRRRAACSGAAQQVEQHRFGLVIALVRKRHAIGSRTRERRVSRLTRRGLEALAAPRPERDASHRERHAQASAQRAAEPLPAVRVRADAMIDVDRAQRDAHARRKLPGARRAAPPNRCLRRARPRRACSAIARAPAPRARTHAADRA